MCNNVDGGGRRGRSETLKKGEEEIRLPLLGQRFIHLGCRGAGVQGI